MEKKAIVLSGIRPTGNLHLGNYFGAVKNFVKMQDTNECFFFIADYHMLTTHPNPKDLQGNVRQVVIEYLAAGKAILALIPPGVAADLLMEARIGLVVPPDGPEAIADALTELFTDWQNGKLNISPVPEVVARYNRRRQTKNLANLLDEVRSG